VFETPERSAMGASVFVAKRGGTDSDLRGRPVALIEHDNRHLWMKLKTIKGSHFSNYREAWRQTRRSSTARFVPPLSAGFPP